MGAHAPHARVLDRHRNACYCGGHAKGHEPDRVRRPASIASPRLSHPPFHACKGPRRTAYSVCYGTSLCTQKMPRPSSSTAIPPTRPSHSSRTRTDVIAWNLPGTHGSCRYAYARHVDACAHRSGCRHFTSWSTPGRAAIRSSWTASTLPLGYALIIRMSSITSQARRWLSTTGTPRSRPSLTSWASCLYLSLL